MNIKIVLGKINICQRDLLKFCVIPFLILSGCTEHALVKKTKPCLGTIVEITVVKENQSRAVIERAIDKAFIEIERIDKM